MTYLAALVVGLLAGTHIATWGMYKDAPHEGFRATSEASSSAPWSDR